MTRSSTWTAEELETDESTGTPSTSIKSASAVAWEGVVSREGTRVARRSSSSSLSGVGTVPVLLVITCSTSILQATSRGSAPRLAVALVRRRKDAPLLILQLLDAVDRRDCAHGEEVAGGIEEGFSFCLVDWDVLDSWNARGLRGSRSFGGWFCS